MCTHLIKMDRDRRSGDALRCKRKANTWTAGARENDWRWHKHCVRDRLKGIKRLFIWDTNWIDDIFRLDRLTSSLSRSLSLPRSLADPIRICNVYVYKVTRYYVLLWNAININALRIKWAVYSRRLLKLIVITKYRLTLWTEAKRATETERVRESGTFIR